MYQGWIKLIIGVWLIISGLISYLMSPVNMMITGFIVAVCCFESYRLWQAMAIGSLGLWLFMSGISHQLMHTHLVSPINFFCVGILLSALGTYYILHDQKKFTSKPAL